MSTRDLLEVLRTATAFGAGYLTIIGFFATILAVAKLVEVIL